MNASNIIRVKNRVPKFEFPINLDLGCGGEGHKKSGFIGLDINDYGQEIVWDLESGIPLPDNSCNTINASQIFEHVEDLIGIMNECHRVLIPEGILALDVPEKGHEKAYIPSHIRRFDKYSFDFFQYEDYAKEYGGSLWELVNLTDDKFILFVRLKPVK